MLNLLIREDRYAIRKEYMQRVFNVFLMATIILAITVLIMKFSIFSFVNTEYTIVEAEKNKIESALLSNEQDEYDKKLSHLEKEFELFNSFKNNPSFYFSKALENRNQEISINDIQIDYLDTGVEIRIGGIAKNRNSLLMFSDTLKTVPEFESVDVPFSSFVKDFDVPFLVSIKVKKE